MSRRLNLVLALIATLAIVSPTSLIAQDTRVSVVISSADGVVNDAEGLIKSSDQPKQWPNLKDYLDVILGGIDWKRPLRFDIILNDGELQQMQYYPIDDINDFLTNVEGFGIGTRRMFAPRGQYKLSEGFTGYMRYLKKPKDDYARITKDSRLLKDRTFATADPTELITPLLEMKVDVAAEIANASVKDVGEREKAFAVIAKEALAGMKQMENEKDVDFELRKLATSHQMEEASRYFSQSELLRLTFNRADDNSASSTLKLKALKGTDLEKSVMEMGTEPSYFASVKQPERSPLSLRTRHPLDKMRQENLTETLKLVRDRVKGQIDETDGLTDSEKKASHEAATILADMLQAGIDSGLIDAMADILPVEEGKNTLLVGIRTPDGSSATKLLELLPKIDPGLKVTPGVEELGDVVIHQVALPDEGPARDYFKSFFADDGLIYIGISKETVYMAAGPEALSKLKETVKAASGSADGDKSLILNLIVEPGPFVRRRDRRNIETKYPKTRKDALESFKDGTDQVKLTLKREGDEIVGETTMQPGILTFAGRVLAQFVKENFDE